MKKLFFLAISFIIIMQLPAQRRIDQLAGTVAEYASTLTLDKLARKLAGLPRPCGIFCNNDWEATITISLPLSALDKLAKKAARRGFKPLHFAKMKLQEFAEEKEAK